MKILFINDRVVLLHFKLWLSKYLPTVLAKLIYMCAAFCLNSIIVMLSTLAHTYGALKKELEMLKQFALWQIWKHVPMVDSKFIIKHLN